MIRSIFLTFVVSGSLSPSTPSTHVLYKKILFCALLVASVLQPRRAQANEGMWLPLLLQSLNEAEMKSLGMKISAADIYSVNQGSLKDAIVHFGGFCTGEVISDRGLVLTNHHCGYEAIADHSTVADNLLVKGWYAAKPADEKLNPGLFVTFIDRIIDASPEVLAGVTPDMDEGERAKLIQRNTERYKQQFTLKPFEEVVVRAFFEGNQYFAFLTRRYPDVRLVGTPPDAVGKFGADTDNWEWPRHTGDFSLFRIYTAPDGSPAEYSPNNVPMRPKRHLEISLGGVKPGDFSMVFGFPGRTDEYLSASAMKQRVRVINPIRIGMRDLSLAVIDSAMRVDAQTKIDYASKQARLANAWKKWRGESEGVEAVNAIPLKNGEEYDFQKMLSKPMLNASEISPEQRRRYARALPLLDSLVKINEAFAKTNAYVGELNYNIDLFRVANQLARRLKTFDANGEAAFRELVPGLLEYIDQSYAGYHADIDERVAAALLVRYYAEVLPAHQSAYAKDQLAFAGSVQAMVRQMFAQSYLTHPERMRQLLRERPNDFVEYLRADPALQFVRQLNGFHESEVLSQYNANEAAMAPLQRDYMDGLMKLKVSAAKLYPDANSTMRVTYGKFEGFTGLKGERYEYMTDLDGVVAKYQPGDYEFDVPARLLALHKAKNYGRYATAEGKLPVCVLGSNHTTGGNSGSPALDAYGRLVGLNFDRTWQSTMSDIHYDPAICRNIMVDIRYVLWLIEKLGEAPHLVAEMDIVDAGAKKKK